MPAQERVNDFVTAVERGEFDIAIERFYTPEASMQENLDAPRKGRDVLVAGERAVMARFAGIRARCVRPAMVAGDHVVIRWIFTFVTKDGGERTLDELAYQRWQGDRIAEERFYYDPKQMAG